MRYFILFLLLFFFHSIDAQNISNSVDFSAPEKQKLVNKYSCFFRTMEDQDRLFRVGISFVSQAPGILVKEQQEFNQGGLSIGIEQRLWTGGAINYEGFISTSTIFHQVEHPSIEDTEIKSSNMTGIRNAIEIRQYINKRKQIQQGVSGNNLSGFYVGVKGEINNWRLYNFHDFNLNDLIDLNGKDTYLLATGGWQQQFGKTGFINFNVNAGRGWLDNDLTTLKFDEGGAFLDLPSQQKWLLDYQLSIGWAFGKSKNYSPKDCSVLQYFDKEHSLWKIDLLGLVNIISNQGVGGVPSLEYEQKLGKTSFSINTFLSLPYTLSFSEESVNSIQVTTGAELRYYYNLKKRIRKGKTGDNLFANYFGVKLGYHTNTYDNLPYGYGIIWGLQRRLFKNIFIGYSFEYLERTSFKAPNYEVFSTTLSKLKIGLAF